ncbi:hypothetical protein N7537_009546 [Penicillium hordei]|uniref:Uncharacterized protein n=1 Tax=Penicillium hordei TaxID=40994 RepID=A0AAD6DT24_9EURO|nr:uncharacterized protein N7537_009546 [Penicillium hordei]KAJ5592642.1 hypothetical protein N7537_009546 [Penicillium hordei]
MPAMLPTIGATTKSSTINNATRLLKRSSMSNPDKYPLYIFLIIAGCIVTGLIGFSVYSMWHDVSDLDKFKDMSQEQRKYMRMVRERNLNMLAVEARRPDMIVPIGELNA